MNDYCNNCLSLILIALELLLIDTFKIAERQLLQMVEK